MVWYDYIKPKCEEKAKLCCIDTESFTVHIKTKRIYVDTEKDLVLQIRNKKERSLTKWKNQKSNCINERWIRKKKWHKKACRIVSEIISKN